MVTITQGESYPVWFNLRLNGENLTPEMISDLKICFAGLRKKLSDDGVEYDAEKQKWKVTPTQEETIGITPGFYDVSVHIKTNDGRIIVRDIQKLCIKEGCCKEVW